MISVDERRFIPPQYCRFEMSGNSDDEKPTGIYEGRKIATGSTFFEWDTAELWRYNDGKWEKLGGGAD